MAFIIDHERNTKRSTDDVVRPSRPNKKAKARTPSEWEREEARRRVNLFDSEDDGCEDDGWEESETDEEHERPQAQDEPMNHDPSEKPGR